VDTVSILYKPVSSIRWFSVEVNAPAAAGAYTWTLPNNPTPEALVRIVSTTDGSVVDESDAPFAMNPTTSVEEGPVPAEYALRQNYPNPFNPSTRIRYALPRPGHVHLAVFNGLGQEVATLVDQVQQPGTYAVEFLATGSGGAGLSSGLYFYRLTAGEFTAMKRMILVK
jgi:hypothetical protein